MTFDQNLHENVTSILLDNQIDTNGKDNPFYARMMSEIDTISHLYREIYGQHPLSDKMFQELVTAIIKGYREKGERPCTKG